MTPAIDALATAAQSKRVAMAEPAEAEKATGYVVGGISPLGQRRRLPVVVDDSVCDHETILVNGGRRGLQLELRPNHLVRAATAMLAQIARR